MRLYVYVLEAKGLPVKDSYVNVQVGKLKSKTRIVERTKNPWWNEEFVFRVHDCEEEVILSVYHHEDSHGLFSSSGELLGRVKIPVWSVANEDNRILPPTWFSVGQPKAGKFIRKDCGKILVSISLHGSLQDTSSDNPLLPSSNVNCNQAEEETDLAKSQAQKIHDGKHWMKAIANRLERIFAKHEDVSETCASSEACGTPSYYEDCVEKQHPDYIFEEAIGMIKSRDGQEELPEDLQGGILFDQIYAVRPHDLNSFLFAPDSKFRRDLANLEGTTNLEEEPWTLKQEEDPPLLTRTVSYNKAATKLIKAVKASEQQFYLKADGKNFAVFVEVSTPEVPYGNMFKVELLYKIMPGPEERSGEESSRLIISWRVNFHQNTMMRGMIEGGARQGLKDSFYHFENLLAQSFRILGSAEPSNRDQIIASLENEQQSDWQLATKHFCNFTMLSTFCMVVYVIMHILLCKPSEPRGLEFLGIDLPDSLGELIACAIITIQVERVFYMASHFAQARLQRGGDHGVKAQGDGWILTVALIEGTNMASLASTGYSDPYVVFTCNGRTKTSSVKLQTCDPQWNEIVEFDAMEEPPSVLDVEVFDFDGPFDQATSLGHAEINFLKHTSTDLADMWIFLEGKLAQSAQSKLHLRIFLDNNNGVETVKEFLTKMEKEVGKKLSLRSPHRNCTFQKLFKLPQDEFLISDFACSLKRKLPLQGRLFLSSRIVGFYANLFGHKTRFFFLWEDIEDIQVLPPSFGSMGSPSLVFLLRKGRGMDARHGAKSQDEEGGLRFHFQSFVSFNSASRTIVALWRTRVMTPEQTEQIAKEQHDQESSSVLDDAAAILDTEDADMSKIYSAELPIAMSSLMELFGGGKEEYRIMEKSGCLNYSATEWESVQPGTFERSVSYKFNRYISIFGGEVTSTQRKVSTDDGWTVNEVMALHNIPFEENYRVRVTYQIEESGQNHSSCKCDVFVHIIWFRSTKFQHRITRNITSKLSQRSKDIFELVERETLLATRLLKSA
ncbi:C2 and GRAM domain-containing protein At5g50170 [Rhodamnia argentea]|uniref:C2 and GRAM domain-containing protein At5g50170 n=1 Tax=Rhodamnia argentea TaxID=178133 RepID=A0A8B8PAX6_9MYRT|nr:C2 and GRAM domain-containing protein At5g50170 [Rhodamnia argentea]XP_030531149.2 C2 and GRAM domain-containing protein At5g50170 [Rhodamnia argentea]XP_030531150.2 C2 and GRAM domain-containing protein At5g50170 [Rhodamnia argentea]XP_048137290.1 C2 and GRAM domain-containing protein At5g50170 [Rhodamnia argentea]